MITGLVAFLNVLRGEARRANEARRGVGRLLGVLSQWAHEKGPNRECKTATEILHGDYGCRLIAAKLLRGAVKSGVH